jgi:molybdopterin-guanine dinucleotide biosynthesis protein B
MAEILIRKNPYIVSFVATCSGTGKTTLIEKLIVILKSYGYRIGALKHNAHRFEMDDEGKDSYRFAHAGADQVIIASKDKLGMVRTLYKELEIKQILSMFENVDIIIVEGYRNSDYPKIEVHRKLIDSSLLCSNPDYHGFIAVATDEKLKVDCEVLDINNADHIAKLIAEKAKEFFETQR